MDWWYQVKLFLEHSSGFSRDAMHVVAGVLLQLLVARLLRRDLSSITALAAIWVLAILNEVSDLWLETWPDPGMQYGEGAKDILLTVFVPTILLMLARWRAEWLVRSAGARPKGETAREDSSSQQLDFGFD